MNKSVEILVVGGGPAGLAAAAAAKEAGVKAEDILIVERDRELGGILNQCIHNGFGLHTFKEELTGPEYAQRYAEKVQAAHIPYLLQTIVVDIRTGDGKDKGVCGTKYVTAMNKQEGIFTVEAGAVVLAMGCRERSRGALNIPGYRPAGIYSAGTAQRYVNIEGRMPGKEVVILGSGDIGLIMARRMTLEGAKVKLVAELMPYSGGLKRNIAQCLDDFGIPLKLSHTVVDIDGKERVKGVTVAQVDENRRPIAGTEEYISCDTLLLSCGLIPENELSAGLGVELNPVTAGPVVNESLETNVEGVFACGNVLHVHDLVEYVSEEAESAGRNAAEYALRRKPETGQGQQRAEKESAEICDMADAGRSAEAKIQDGLAVDGDEAPNSAAKQGSGIAVKTGRGVRYTVPSVLRPQYMQEEQVIRFRVGEVCREVELVVYFDGAPVMRMKKRIMVPAEMEQVKLKKENIEKHPGLKEIQIAVEQA